MIVDCPLCKKTISKDTYEPSMLVLARHLHAAHTGFGQGCACGKGLGGETGSAWKVPEWIGWHLHNLEEPLDEHLLFHALGRQEPTRENDLTASLVGLLTNPRTNAFDLTPAIQHFLNVTTSKKP